MKCRMPTRPTQQPRKTGSQLSYTLQMTPASPQRCSLILAGRARSGWTPVLCHFGMRTSDFPLLQSHRHVGRIFPVPPDAAECIGCTASTDWITQQIDFSLDGQ